MPTATGAAVGLAGAVFVGLGLWARRETRRALEREHVAGPDGTPVTTAASVPATAELIRAHTLAATGGRTCTVALGGAFVAAGAEFALAGWR
ncbi:MAG TPA: hypothetical protein VFJ75_08230 [Gaiellaceae bacterium]|nr:hypothetical protein [Gaiellaceae bacterium]